MQLTANLGEENMKLANSQAQASNLGRLARLGKCAQVATQAGIIPLQ